MAAPIDHKAVWRLVRSQEQVITRRQLGELGLSPSAIRHRIARGRLRVLWPGVYLVANQAPTRNAVFIAAVLAAGRGAALSHASAAAAWRIRSGGVDPIHVSVPCSRRVRLDGIEVHRRNPMPPTTSKGALVLCQPLFTLVDLAAELDDLALEAAVNEADKLGLMAMDGIEAALDDAPLYPGVAKLRKVLARYTRTDSDLERRFLRIVRKARLPLPETQGRVGPGRIDFHWPDLGLVVETDGLTYHRTPTQQLRDRERDQAHAVAGRTQLRYANVQIRESPDDVASTLRKVIRRLRQQRQ